MYREILAGVLDLYIAARLSFWEIIQFSTKIYFHTIVSMPSFLGEHYNSQPKYILTKTITPHFTRKTI